MKVRSSASDCMALDCGIEFEPVCAQQRAPDSSSSSLVRVGRWGNALVRSDNLRLLTFMERRTALTGDTPILSSSGAPLSKHHQSMLLMELFC